MVSASFLNFWRERPFSEKLHSFATFAFLVVWVGGWGEAEVITFVTTASTASSENAQSFRTSDSTGSAACACTDQRPNRATWRGCSLKPKWRPDGGVLKSSSLPPPPTHDMFPPKLLVSAAFLHPERHINAPSPTRRAPPTTTTIIITTTTTTTQ